MFAGEPLVNWTIKALLKSRMFTIENIFISTDSVKYADIVKNYFPNIGVHRRSKDSASDRATTADMLVEFLKYFNFDRDNYFVLCQATSPLRNEKQICEAMKVYAESDKKAVVSVTEVGEPIELYTRLDEHKHLMDIVGIDKAYHRQKMSKRFLPNGAIFIANVGKYLDQKSFFTHDTVGYVMSKETSIDIDDIVDFKIAEAILKM